MPFNISNATIFDSILWSLAEMPLTLFWNNFITICLEEAAARREGGSPNPFPIQSFGIFAMAACKVAS